MIFLVGAMRSGTNWLQRMLSAHPQIATTPSETHLFSYGLEHLATIVHHGAAGSPATGSLYMEVDEYRDALRDFCDTAFLGLLQRSPQPDAHFLVERSPHHVYALDLIADVYPDAQVIHIIRDGRDVVRSQLAQQYGPEDLAEAARSWRAAIESARAAAPRLHRYVEVRYESLLADPGGEFSRLLAAIGVPLDEATLEAAVAEAGTEYNVDTSDRRVGAGKWKASWNADDLGTFLAAVGPLAEEFGFGADDLPETAASESQPIVPAEVAEAGWLVRLRRRVRPTHGPVVGGPTDKVEQRTHLLNAVLDALASGRIDKLRALARADHFEVQVITPSGNSVARGEEAATTLLAHVQEAAVPWRRQQLGSVHISWPTSTAVLRHVDNDGTQAFRVVVVRSQGDFIDMVTLYDFPGPGP